MFHYTNTVYFLLVRFLFECCSFISEINKKDTLDTFAEHAEKLMFYGD